MTVFTGCSRRLLFIFGSLFIMSILILGCGGRNKEKEEMEGENGMFSGIAKRFTGSEVVQEAFSQSVATGDETAIDISHSHGNIAVRGWDKNEVKIEGEKIVGAKDEETARMYAEQMKVEIESEDGRIIVRTIRPERERAWKIQKITINYELYAPNALEVTLENRHGNVRVEGFMGGLDLNSQHGQLEVAQIGGNASIEHQHGNVDVSQISGDASVSKQHGKLSIRSVDGELELSHEHGNVEVATIGKSADLHKRHGNLTVASVGGILRLDQQHGNVQLKTIEDNVEITKQHGKIDVETVNGNLSIDSQHTALRIVGVDGDVSLRGAHGNAHIEDVSGTVDFSRSHSKAKYVNVRRKT